MPSDCNSLCSNTARVVLLILGPCTEILREILRREISPKNLSQKVKTQKKNVMNLNQERMIFPEPSKTYNGDYSDFDITLLYILLRNFCLNIPPPANKWGNEPKETDRGVGANIERIRLFRNKHYGHQTSISIPDQDFKRAWFDISRVITELERDLGTSTYYQKIAKTMETAFIDRRKKIKAFFKRMLTEWEENDALYVELHNFPAILKSVKKQSFVTFVGSPGSGKSATAHHVAFALKAEEYEVLKVHNLQDILYFSNPKKEASFCNR